MARKNMTVAERFWAQVSPPDANGCRMWRGARHHATGYGLFKVCAGFQAQAHAFAWKLTNAGPLHPSAKVFCHSCDVNYPPGSHEYRPCCEPSHIFPGTPRANVHDAVAKNRMASGDRHSRTKIPDAMIASVRGRLDAGERQVDIAASLGVGQAAISRIKRGVRKAARA